MDTSLDYRKNPGSSPAPTADQGVDEKLEQAAAAVDTPSRRRGLSGGPLKPVLRILSSLQLTVTLLLLSIILVFVATLAQATFGLFYVQEKFFKSFIVWYEFGEGGLSIPVMPGGYTIGWLLILNLITAHISRFRLTWKKFGIHLIHAGLIMLLLGEFFTGILTRESQMELDEGETQAYTEHVRDVELAIIDVTDPEKQRVVAIPQQILKDTPTLSPQDNPALPFTLKVDDWFSNTRSPGQLGSGKRKLRGYEGEISRGFVHERGIELIEVNEANKIEEGNIPTVFFEIEAKTEAGEKKDFGHWAICTAFRPERLVIDDRVYEMKLRPRRFNLPFSVRLNDFRHERYPGTEVPKDFTSMVTINDPEHNENRDVRIWMNNPLRYRGYTFYQLSFKNDDRTSVLQVVENPVAFSPYLSCSIMTLGLLFQFGFHLFSFVNKRTRKS